MGCRIERRHLVAGKVSLLEFGDYKVLLMNRDKLT